MNTFKHRWIPWLAASLLVLVMVAACAPASILSAGLAAPTAESASGASDYAVVDNDAQQQTLAAISTGNLSQVEASGLLYMREEEKLAHDVYVTLYDMWGLPIFQSIAGSEQTHTDAVKALLDRYDLPDPAAGNGVGEFSDPELQALYDRLISIGSESLERALRVGAAIEEIDILDLEERIAQTDQADIVTVYQNLTKGSRNHLRSFVSTLERQTGATYQPQHLTPEAYDQIVQTAIERGGRRTS